MTKDLYLKVTYRGTKDDDDALLELAEAVAEHADVARVKGFRSDSSIAFTGLSVPVDIPGAVEG